jgi:hypothetical protein
LDPVWGGWQRALALGFESQKLRSWDNYIKVYGVATTFLLSRKRKRGGYDCLFKESP